ncbi:MAG: hypothetical protein IJY79_08005 [Clostridia bacterium]|nr:hypothetical protein [Clostridia bacterium]
MQKLDILLADLKINIEHSYDFMPEFCKKYISSFDTPDITAKTDEKSVLKEKEMVPSAPIEICESLCIYRSIGEQLPRFDRFVFHGAAIEYDGKAYLFTAPSGTGKTTHINLWKHYLDGKVDIINGDKPIIRVGEASTVYGTPWAGKEGYQRNASAPLKAICILKQGKTNNITRLDKKDAVNHLMRQVYLPHDPVSLSKTLALLGLMIENIPVYILQCDISEDAFKVSYNALTAN